MKPGPEQNRLSGQVGKAFHILRISPRTGGDQQLQRNSRNRMLFEYEQLQVVRQFDPFGLRHRQAASAGQQRDDQDHNQHDAGFLSIHDNRSHPTG